MSQRLGEEIVRHYDAGVWAFPAKPAEEYANLITKINLDELLTRKNPKQEIQSVPAQNLYWAMHAKGLEECSDVLALTSNEQFKRIFDYSTWSNNELQPRLIFAWLKICKQKSVNLMLSRFRDLDEEYQVAALEPFIRIYSPDDVEKMSEGQQDQLLSLPNNALYYTVDTGDQELFDGICDLINTAVGEDIEYAFQLLSSAAYTPPHEQELLLKQFRKARLEEDGFVSEAEAFEIFSPHFLNPGLIRSYLQDIYFQNDSNQKSLATTTAKATRSFFSTALQFGVQNQILCAEKTNQIWRSIAHLANGLSVATKTEPGSIRGLLGLLNQIDAGMSLTLEAQSSANIEKAAHILKNVNIKILYKQHFSIINPLKEQVLKRLRSGNPKVGEQLKRFYEQQKFGATLNFIDLQVNKGLDHHLAEHLKALFNRFPAVAEQLKDEQGKITTRYYFKQICCVIDLVYMAKQLDQLLDENLDPKGSSGRTYGATFFDAYLGNFGENSKTSVHTTHKEETIA